MNTSVDTRRNGIRPLTSKFPYLILIPALLAAIALIPACAASIPAAPPLVNASDYEDQGMARMAEKNWSGLMAVVDEGLAAYPEDAELLCLKGYALRKTGHYQEAADTVGRAIVRDPKPVRYVNRGYALLALMRYQDALSDADMALSLDGNYTTAYCVKALALLGLGDTTGARQAIETAISLEPENAFYRQVQGRVYAQSGDYTRAVESFRRSIELQPDTSLPWPGFANATTDLERAEAQCATDIPVPTRAAFPAVLAGAAFVIAGRLKRR